MNFLKILDDDFNKKIFWSVMAIILVISISLFYLARKTEKESLQQTITVERVTAEYELVEIKNASPFVVDFKDVKSNQVYKNVLVSTTCPLMKQQALIGKKMKLMRFTNVNIANNITSYHFRGAYEELCSNIRFNPQSGDNYFKQ